MLARLDDVRVNAPGAARGARRGWVLGAYRGGAAAL